MDGRKNNGNKGHSTKAKGIDKRTNPYKNAVRDAVSADDVIKVLKAMYKKAVDKQDTKAAQIVLDYTVGKPKQQVDVTTDGEGLSFEKLFGFENSSE